MVTTDSITAYLKEIETWHEQVEADLRAPDSWLALVGLEALHTGENTVGSSAGCDVHLPASVPEQIGRITVQDGSAIMQFSDARLNIDGQAVVPGQLYVLNQGHHDGEMPLVSMGSVTFFVIEREGAFYVRVRDANSPNRLNFKGRKWFPTRPEYRVKAAFTPHPTKRVVAVETSKGTISHLQNIGYVEFDLQGEQRRLEAFETTGKRLWFIFKDKTSGSLSYGAGRFLYAPILSDGTVDLDFNKAYHPPCAFSEYAMCPLPPPENALRIPIEAGEQYNR